MVANRTRMILQNLLLLGICTLAIGLRADSRADDRVGYYVIGATPMQTDWQHYGSFDDLQSATAEVQTQVAAGKMCSVWVITVTDALRPGFEPIYKGKAYI